MSAGKFIVVFKDSATPEQISKYSEQVASNGGQVTAKYNVFKGFAAELTPQLLGDFQGDSVKDGSIIQYIEPDGVVTTQ